MESQALADIAVWQRELSSKRAGGGHSDADTRSKTHDIGHRRHQLPALAEAGYYAVAPDLRGYGKTNASKASENYSTIFIGGERDCSVMFGSFEAMKATLPSLRRIIILPGCGHWVQEEQPDGVITAIIGFLQQEGIR